MTTRPVPTTLDPLDPSVRSDARRLVSTFEDDSKVGRVVRAMLTDLADGERVVVVRSEEEVTPSQAARIMGVTRQHVDRLCDDGILAFRRLPASRHRRIRVQDVLDATAERDRRRAGREALRTALDDAGLLDDA